MTSLKRDKLVDTLTTQGRYVLDPQQPCAPPPSPPAHIEQIIRARIGDSTYAALTWLPPVAALVAEFGVGHSCVYGALKSLNQEKLVATLNPRGTYVIDRDQPWSLPLGRISQAARIGHTIRQRLGDGTYPPGSQLPTNEQLRTEFDAHPNTISNALRPLRKEGLIYSGRYRRVYAALSASDSPGLRSAEQEITGHGAQLAHVTDVDLERGPDRA
jgi:DNA-binding GntR family transcriptional regulator